MLNISKDRFANTVTEEAIRNPRIGDQYSNGYNNYLIANIKNDTYFVLEKFNTYGNEYMHEWNQLHLLMFTDYREYLNLHNCKLFKDNLNDNPLIHNLYSNNLTVCNHQSGEINYIFPNQLDYHIYVQIRNMYASTQEIRNNIFQFAKESDVDVCFTNMYGFILEDADFVNLLKLWDPKLDLKIVNMPYGYRSEIINNGYITIS